jgi:hypothetical protein
MRPILNEAIKHHQNQYPDVYALEVEDIVKNTVAPMTLPRNGDRGSDVDPIARAERGAVRNRGPRRCAALGAGGGTRLRLRQLCCCPSGPDLSHAPRSIREKEHIAAGALASNSLAKDSWKGRTHTHDRL